MLYNFIQCILCLYNEWLYIIDTSLFQTFSLVNKRMGKKVFFRFSKDKSLFLFSFMNPIRRFCIRLICTQYPFQKLISRSKHATKQHNTIHITKLCLKINYSNASLFQTTQITNVRSLLLFTIWCWSLMILLTQKNPADFP